MIPAGEVGELLTALIQNECVNDGTPESGHEHRSVATLADYFGQEGRVFEPVPGRRSVVYRVPGSRPGAPRLMLNGHLDVVPVNRDSWSCDPFAGEHRDGFIWGRGAVDMLNQTSAFAAVFRRYLTGEFHPLPGDLLFLGVADEEAGGRHGAEWLVDNAWDQVGCEYQLTEIAMPGIPTPDGSALPVTVAEKGPYWRKLSAAGVPGHASQPYGTVNALMPVALAMARLGEADTPVEITGEWRAFVDGLGLPDDERDALLDPDRIDGAIEDLAAEDLGYARWVHACTHLTVSPTVLHAGVKANVIPDAGRAEVDIRAVPGQDAGTIDEHFRKVLGADLYDQLHIEPVMDFPAGSSEAAGPLWEAIGDAHEDITGFRRLIPTLIPVATDARFFRARGTVAYGVGLFDDRVAFGDLLRMFHGNDERVTEESLGRTTELIRITLERFGGAGMTGNLVCDLDGVLYLGEEPIAGSGEALAQLSERGYAPLFVTNNSTTHAEDVAARIARLTGFPATPDQVLTSAMAAVLVLQAGGIGSVFTVGEAGLDRTLAEAGFRVTDDWREAEAVVVGLDRNFHYDTLRDAVSAIRNGAAFVATNIDPTYPTADRLWPGGGSMVAAIASAGEREAVVAGKPYEPIRRLIADRIGPGDTWVIGDRVDTDLELGRLEGWARVLVLSGATPGVDGLAPAEQPELVLDSIADLPAELP